MAMRIAQMNAMILSLDVEVFLWMAFLASIGNFLKAVDWKMYWLSQISMEALH